jgi:ketosteroid isomerase-like protein
VLRGLYAAFNDRDVDRLLAAMTQDVDWPNVLEDTRVHGPDAVRTYWEAQFAAIDPHVDPVAIETTGDTAVVTVHQVVRDLDGNVLADQVVEHVYRFRDALVARMDVRPHAN